MAENKNALSGAIAYLAGAITFVNDDGITWRNHLKTLFKKKKINVKFFDPCDKPKGLGKEVGLEKSTVQGWKAKGYFKKVRDWVKAYRRIDLRMVDNSNFLIIYLDTDVFTLGSIDELLTAERQRKPIFVIVKQGRKKAPDWLFAIVHHDLIFDTVEDCVDYIEKLNSGEIKLNNKWVLYNGKFI